MFKQKMAKQLSMTKIQIEQEKKENAEPHVKAMFEMLNNQTRQKVVWFKYNY